MSDEEKRNLIARKQFFADWERIRLRKPDQLPELEGAKLNLVWDCLDEATTVLTHGDIEVWREPALYEGYDRFREVVLILKQRYGERLADVVPTPAAGLYLYGDNLRAPDYVTTIRESLKQSHGRHAGA